MIVVGVMLYARSSTLMPEAISAAVVGSVVLVFSFANATYAQLLLWRHSGAIWVRRVLRFSDRRRRRWRLFRGETAMECFITDLNPTGAKIRFDYGGELYHEFMHVTREDAEREAQDKRHQLTCMGWCERRNAHKYQPH